MTRQSEIDENNEDLAPLVEGLRLISAIYTDTNRGEWGDHGELTLTFEGGIVLTVTSYGYDASGLSIVVTPCSTPEAKVEQVEGVLRMTAFVLRDDDEVSGASLYHGFHGVSMEMTEVLPSS